eukprot:TRINITY_DN882_c0_g4_i3.p2 TRINITY_DN882_c0_g4~~TRINITY_DN882_c0_g4_i3.p2  ORF type:complete len:100 (-),score=27.04 TRINITY_DN882_c0_g4_i3:62-361(-)
MCIRDRMKSLYLTLIALCLFSLCQAEQTGLECFNKTSNTDCWATKGCCWIKGFQKEKNRDREDMQGCLPVLSSADNGNKDKGVDTENFCAVQKLSLIHI